MKTKSIIEGLTILNKYYDDPDGWHTGADHEILYARATDKPVSPEDVARLVELKWFQPEVPMDDDDNRVYVPGEGWAAYV